MACFMTVDARKQTQAGAHEGACKGAPGGSLGRKGKCARPGERARPGQCPRQGECARPLSTSHFIWHGILEEGPIRQARLMAGVRGRHQAGTGRQAGR